MRPAFLFFALTLLGCSSHKETVEVTEQEKPSEYHQLKDPNTLLLTEVSTDPDYGFTPEKPIMTGGAHLMQGPFNQRRFINALKAPNGKEITYKHVGTCCPFTTENGMIRQKGVLDIYELFWKGQELPVKLYFNMYDYGPLQAPMGFLIRE